MLTGAAAMGLALPKLCNLCIWGQRGMCLGLAGERTCKEVLIVAMHLKHHEIIHQ